MSVISKNRFSLETIAKVRRSPAKRTTLVSLETPSLPLKKNRTSGFSCQTNMYTKHHLKPKVRFLRKPPPSQTNFVRFTGLLRTFAMVPYNELVFAILSRQVTGFSPFWEAVYSLIAKFPPRAYLMQHNPEEIYNRRQQPHRVSYISDFILKSIVLLLVCVITHSLCKQMHTMDLR